ncbi:MAG: endonuclease/exonuclease/phosphatase family protein [Planctomycetes bacterium]|nr:endonuclease/exonuclease/phosphatase family protein [Planctomycetota bacterium]
MRLLSWNVHKGIGGIDRRYELWRIAAVILHHDPDVLLLQEVDDRVPRTRGHRQMDMLGELLGYPHRAFHPTVHLGEGRRGNATLSRFPISQEVQIDLTFPMKKARGALLTDLLVPVREHRYLVHVVNLHLGLSGVERRWQVRRLLRSPAVASLDGRSRVVIAGDTNDWAGALPRGALREAGFRCVTGTGVRALRTFPAWGPIGSLDRVFVRGGIRWAHAYPSRLSLVRIASDHRPLLVDLRLHQP